MSKFRRIKMRVNSPEEHKVIQEWLFADGCTWNSCGKYVSYINSKFLYVDGFGVLSYGSETGNYAQHSYTEVVPEFTLLVDIPEPVKEKINILGKTYFKQDVEKAIRNLQELYNE